ncbi:MAG: cupin domain-containing protein [Anaerolineae bacterium]|nr:cupin domain-containing protein [Anaerolineae bacterium]
MALLEPFAAEFNLETGVMEASKNLIQRRLSSMRGMYADEAAEAALLAAGDPMIYEVYTSEVPEEAGQVLYCTTTIYPGRVGDEYFMTKGHFHSLRDRGEIYLGLSGEGYLLLQTEEGEPRAVPMHPGTAAYVPPYWAHRTANVGDEPFVFFAAWPGDSGHDYGTIEKIGFPQLLVSRDGQPALVGNPRFSGVTG